ncbi:MAG: ribonuclease Z [Chloroflexi bacterium]|nr:MAG: ribonuclease Z [Chloroflexota bacterium]
MKLAFLGTGAAFSVERYNAGIVVLGIDPGAIDVIFLTHFHGDHTLGLPTYVLHRGFISKRPLTIVGPAGLEERLESLFKAAWGVDWGQMRDSIPLLYREAGESGSVAGVDYETVQLDHGTSGCTGYRLRIDGRLLAYSGDTSATPPLDRLVEGAEIAIVEATGPGEPFSHLGWEQAEALRDRHPNTRFIWVHVYAGTVEGAAADLQVLDV